WESVRRIIVLANTGPAWEELVGGFRPDGSRFVSLMLIVSAMTDTKTHVFTQGGIIEQGARLLHLQDSKQFNEQILIRAAKHSEENDRIPEAIKLYNLAGDYSTVVACLAQALGNTISQPNREAPNVKIIEQTAADILRHYERTNRAVGKD